MKLPNLALAVLLAGVSPLLIPASALAAPIYVSANAPPGGDGASWDTAFRYLQEALSVAQGGDEIRVAQGTYRPDQSVEGSSGDRNASFFLQNLLTINGGYAGFGAANPDARDPRTYVSILSGDIGVAGDRTDNSFHVVYAQGDSPAVIDRTAVLDGFTISGGYTGAGRNGSPSGAGMYLSDAGPTIRNCIIEGNLTAPAVATSQPAGSGAGVYCERGSPAFIDCTIQENVAGDASPGICNDGSAQSGGLPGDGAGMLFTASDPVLVNCRILNNHTGAGQVGGACDTNCTAGTRGGDGGGVLISGAESALFVNCLIAGNTTGAGGAGGTPTAGTQCNGGRGGAGAGVYSVNSGVNFINCTFAANVAGLGGAGDTNGVDGAGGGIAIIILGRQTVTITNCVLWANISRGVSDQAAQIAGLPLTISYSCVQGLTDLSGTGNTASDPLFVNSAAGDFRLSAGSGAIDVGLGSALPADTFDLDADGNGNEPIPFDLAHQPRILDGNRDGTDVVDMGCFEFFFDCNSNDVPDELDIARGTSQDCNQNRIPDECDISSGTSQDCNHNNVPDECDIAAGTSQDCNQNSIPDECDIAAGTSQDCNASGIPDECETDSDYDGVIDVCDGCPLDPLKTAPGRCGCGVAETDTDGDGVPDCVDNCPTVYNPDQTDTDQDGVGDACDDDSCFLLCIIHLMEGQGFTQADVEDCHCPQHMDEMLAVLRANSGRFPMTEAELLAAAQAAGADTEGTDESAGRTAASALCPTTAAIALALSLTGLVMVRYRARS